MKKALLHIGTGKTGTTSLQQSCATSPSIVENHITYPLIPGFEGQQNQNCLSIIYKSFEKLPRRYKSRYKDSKSLYLRDAELVKDHFFSALRNSENIIISAEYLANYSLDEIDNLVADLSRFNFDEIKILIYVRDPVSYYISNVQQRIKASHLIDNPKTFRYNFKKYIATWLQGSPKSISVVPYEKGLLEGPGLLESFEYEINEFFDSSNVRLNTVTKQNTSMSLEALVVLQQYRKRNYSNSNNTFAEDSDVLRDLLTNLDSDYASSIRLHEKYEETIIANHLDDLIWLKNNFAVEFEGLLDIELNGNAQYGSTDPSQLFKSYDIDNIFRAYRQVLSYLLKGKANASLNNLSMH